MDTYEKMISDVKVTDAGLNSTFRQEAEGVTSGSGSHSSDANPKNQISTRDELKGAKYINGTAG